MATAGSELEEIKRVHDRLSREWDAELQRTAAELRKVERRSRPRRTDDPRDRDQRVLEGAASLGWPRLALRVAARRHSRGEITPMTQVMIDRAAPHDSLGTTLAALVRYRTLLRKLVLKDLKLKYRGSALGFLWSLVNPLVMIAVYSFAFRYILQVDRRGLRLPASCSASWRGPSSPTPR